MYPKIVWICQEVEPGEANDHWQSVKDENKRKISDGFDLCLRSERRVGVPGSPRRAWFIRIRAIIWIYRPLEECRCNKIDH